MLDQTRYPERGCRHRRFAAPRGLQVGILSPAAKFLALMVVVASSVQAQASKPYKALYNHPDDLAFAKNLALTQLSKLCGPPGVYEDILQGNTVVILADLSASGHKGASNGPSNSLVPGKSVILVSADRMDTCGLTATHEGFHLALGPARKPVPGKDATQAEIMAYFCEEKDAHCATLAAMLGSVETVSCEHKNEILEDLMISTHLCQFGTGSGEASCDCPGLTGSQVFEMECE